MKKFLLATATILASAPAAYAGVGCELGGGLGYSMATSTISATGGGSIDGAGLRGSQPDAQIRGECGYRFESSPFYLGLFGEYEWKDVQFSINTTTHADIGDGYAVGGRVGYMVGNAMPYVGIAYKHSDLNWTNFGPNLPNGVDGVKFSGGVEFAPFKDFKYLTLSPEITYTDYNKFSVGNLDFKNRELAGMLRVNIALFANGQAPVSVPSLK